MIFNIRGLSGSGKTTLTKRIMEESGTRVPVYLGAKHPSHYIIGNLVVLGPYEHEQSVGGADTINNILKIETYIEHYHALNYDILFEAMLYSANSSLPLSLRDKRIPMTVYFLDVPAEVVAEQRKQRSLNIGGTGIFETATGILTQDTLDRSYEKLTGNGIPCFRGTADTIFENIMQIRKDSTLTPLPDNIRELDDKLVGKYSKRKNNKTLPTTLFG